jgi:hypothetical protein
VTVTNSQTDIHYFCYYHYDDVSEYQCELRLIAATPLFGEKMMLSKVEGRVGLSMDW